MSKYWGVEEEQRNHTIDVIKGIAIIMVLITHYNWTNEQRLIPIFPFIINMAVPLFMIASGYVWTKSYYRHRINSFDAAYSRNEILRKILRISVPYVVIVVWQLLDPNISIAFNHKAEYITWFLNGTSGPGGYYYPVMLQMTILFPILFYIVENMKGGLLLCLLINASYEVMKWSYGINEFSYRLISFRYIFLVAVGIFITKNNVSKVMAATFSAVGGIFILATTYGLYMPKIVTYWTSTSFISSMWVVPIAAYLIRNTNVNIIPLEIIGEASWHIFLVQMVWYQQYSFILRKIIEVPVLNLIFGCIFCIILGIMFCYVDTRIVSRIYKIVTS